MTDKAPNQSALPSPLLLGSRLDGQVTNFIIALLATVGVVNIAIVLAAAEVIVATID